MRRLVLLLCACGGDGGKDLTIADDSDADADADTDADSDADADADADSDADADPEARMRVLHVAPGLPPQDLLGNGNPGSPPMVGLAWLDAFPPTAGWVSRPAGEYTFELFDAGSPTPWTTFPTSFDEALFYGIVIAGERPGDTGGTLAPATVLVMEEPRSTVPVGNVRIRWTNAAATLADRPYAIRDAVTDATYATVGFGEWADVDQLPAQVNAYVDLDDDGACDEGEAFQDFTRQADEYFHVLVVSDPAGALFLVGHGEDGGVPVRASVPCPP